MSMLSGSRLASGDPDTAGAVVIGVDRFRLGHSWISVPAEVGY